MKAKIPEKEIDDRQKKTAREDSRIHGGNAL